MFTVVLTTNLQVLFQTNSSAAGLPPHAYDKHKQQLDAGSHMSAHRHFFTPHIETLSYPVQSGVVCLHTKPKCYQLFQKFSSKWHPEFFKFDFIHTKLSTELQSSVRSRASALLLCYCQQATFTSRISVKTLYKALQMILLVVTAGGKLPSVSHSHTLWMTKSWLEW